MHGTSFLSVSCGYCSDFLQRNETKYTLNINMYTYMLFFYWRRGPLFSASENLCEYDWKCASLRRMLAHFLALGHLFPNLIRMRWFCNNRCCYVSQNKKHQFFFKRYGLTKKFLLLHWLPCHELLLGRPFSQMSEMCLASGILSLQECDRPLDLHTIDRLLWVKQHAARLRLLSWSWRQGEMAMLQNVTH